MNKITEDIMISEEIIKMRVDEWHPQDGDTGYSWLQFPPQEQQPTSIQEQNTTERILEHEGEPEALTTSETKKKTVFKG